MIVIGSFTSANSKRLTKLSLERNSNSYQVMDENDIDESWFNNIESIGISAGASTPDNIIEQVIKKVKKISRINKKEEIYEQQSL
jgi:4-hydroxy-3-methylbut-2-enyl diphosphate reductase